MDFCSLDEAHGNSKVLEKRGKERKMRHTGIVVKQVKKKTL